MKIPEKHDLKVKAFLLFLHNTKSIDVSFDNISIEIISERNDFILDQFALYALSFLDSLFLKKHSYRVFYSADKTLNLKLQKPKHYEIVFTVFYFDSYG